MASISKIADWAISNSQRLDLKATRLTWVEEWLPGFFDYRVFIRFQGEEYRGRGISRDEQTAFVKAFAEAIERASTANLDYPWATAAYPDYPEAMSKAYRELVGIDRMLCHHFCRKPAQVVSLQSTKDILPLKPLIKMLRKYRLEIVLCEMRPVSDAKVAAAFIWSTDDNNIYQGTISGTGCEIKFVDAAAQAVIEALREGVAIFVGKVEQELKALRGPVGNPWWHIWTNAASERSKNYLKEKLLGDAGCVSYPAENISSADVDFTELAGLRSFLPGIPLIIAQAKSDKLIRPQFGPFVGDIATMKRLEEFNGGPIEVITDIPHFYG